MQEDADMPGLNKQGPEGTGPMTGGKRGQCAQQDGDNQQDQQFGQGRGRGMSNRCRGPRGRGNRAGGGGRSGRQNR